MSHVLSIEDQERAVRVFCATAHDLNDLAAAVHKLLGGSGDLRLELAPLMQRAIGQLRNEGLIDELVANHCLLRL